MFKKFRRQMTLLNMTLFSLLLLLLSVCTYWTMVFQIEDYAIESLDQIAGEILIGRQYDDPAQRRKSRLPSPFFFRTNESNELKMMSSYFPIAKEQQTAFFQLLLEDKDGKGLVEWQGREYVYFSMHDPENNGRLVVVRDFSLHRHSLDVLLETIGWSSGISLALALIVSFFLAARAMIPVRNAWQQQQDFVTETSHELRTPLAVIRANLDILWQCKEETIESQAQWLRHIDRESQRMNRLVDSLLFLARADAQQQPLVRETVWLNKVVYETVQTLASVALAKRIRLDQTVAGDAAISGDRSRISQMLMILLDNAIRHTPEQGHIEITVRSSERTVMLEVTDNGEGIAAEELPHIFDRFYQSPDARDTGAAGLGLSIARWIAESHGGTIKAQSEKGCGSSFTVTLPLLEKSLS